MRVLIVEDNPEVMNTTAALMEELGHDVVRASGADDALARLYEGSGISLVFSDIVMPGRLDGIGLAEAVRQKDPGMPILLATGYSEVLQRLGAEFPVIRKPYQMHELGEALAQLRR